MGEYSTNQKKMDDLDKFIKEATEYDSKKRSESHLDAPQFIHDLFTTNKFGKDHPDRIYVDVLFDLTLWIIVGGGLVATGYLPGPIYLTLKFVLFMGRYILLLHYLSHV